MTDPRVAAIVAKRERVVNAMVGVAVIGFVYLLVMFFVITQAPAVQPGWMRLLSIPVWVLAAAFVALRIWSRWLRTDALAERVKVKLDRAEATLDEIERDRTRD